MQPKAEELTATPMDRLEKRDGGAHVDWLDGRDTPGLGAHLYRALNSKTPVVGIAKNPYTGASQATPVLRRRSGRSPFVTAVGIDQRMAADHVAEMHGASRIPTLLKLADHLSKGRGGSQA